MEPNSCDVPVPLIGGNTSNENAVFSEDFMLSITLIAFSSCGGYFSQCCLQAYFAFMLFKLRI